MNPEQERALALFDRLIVGTGNRSMELLASTAQNPSHQLLPGEWAEGWCKGWAFAVQPTLASSLDIRLTPRQINKRETLVWTQGSAFAFQVGYTIHDSAAAQQGRWEDALHQLGCSLQIVSAASAESASKETPRNPGSVTFDVYRPNAERTALERHEQRSVSQDAFVRILIEGLPEA